MGIDYVLDLECEPKAALGVANIVQLVKSRDRGRVALEAARTAGDRRPPRELALETIVYGRIERAEETTVQALLDRAAPLDVHALRCAACPANREARAGYGCYRSIPYPITVAAEDWLLARLPDDLRSNTAGRMLRDALEDFGWDGGPAAALRARGRTFFESANAPRVEWGDTSVSGDQLFQMLFLVGPLQPSHAMMLALFLGLLPHDTDPSDLQDEARRAGLLEQATIPPEDSGVERLADYLRALPLAARLGVRILVDA